MDFEIEGSKIMKRSKKSFSSFIRRFRSHFGTTPTICLVIWERLDPYETILPTYRRVKFKHLLWALLFMKVYGTEELHTSLTGVDEKTFRKWSWIFIDAIADLECEVVNVYSRYTIYMIYFILSTNF